MPNFRKLKLSGTEFKFIDESKIPLPEQAPNGEYDQILRTNGDGTTRWDNAATQEEIGSAVEDWLEENITNGETLVVDGSLTISGAAADAKVTGDNVHELKSAINTLQPAATAQDVGKALVVKTVDPITGKPSAYEYGATSNYAPAIIDTASGDIASFDDGAGGLPIKKLLVNIDPVQEGSGNPSPENMRPISGWTAANVTRTGKNLFRAVDGDYQGSNKNTSFVCADGIYTLTNAAQYELGVTALISGDRVALALGANRFVKPGTYAFSLDVTNLVGTTAFNNIRLALVNDVTGENFVISNGQSATIADPATITEVQCSLSGGFPVGASISFRVQLERSSAVTEYEPYQGNTIHVTFPTEVGTVYGGMLTINDDGTGALLVDSVKCPMWTPQDNSDWTLIWDYNATYSRFSRYVYYADSPQNGPYWPANKSRVFCECYKNVTTFTELANSDYAVTAGYPSSYEGRLVVKDSRFTDAVSFNQWLRSNNVYASYKILPQFQQTYQLTAQQVLDTLYGTNKIWADCGDVEVEYRADTKLYIQKINAPTDADMTADTQIASGRYFIVGGNLYLSTTTIPAGDAIIPGTNCTKTNLAEALNALNS